MCLNPKASTTVRQAQSASNEVVKAQMHINKTKMVTTTHSDHVRDTKYDWILFVIPALAWNFTPIIPAYITSISRILSTRVTMALHYRLVDKDNYKNKLKKKQLAREKDDYLVGIVLHMWVQILLQVIFPNMFFVDNSLIKSCAICTFWSHVLIVEPLYYFAHKWLHIPEHMKAMHGFHHLSINTLPSTSLVQNFQEHFVYIATFGPAFLVPFVLGGHQHWAVIAVYLILFDLANAWGHTNIRIRHCFFTHPLSPMKYLWYTPEFHLGHHAYFRANYGLFMPIWDFVLGTHREYRMVDDNLLPQDQQDFVFIGHNGGLGHLLTCPEFSVYNVYDEYKRFLPMKLEFLLMGVIGYICRLFMKSYSLSRYAINSVKIGRVICIVRTPIDYFSRKNHGSVNREILQLIKDQNQVYGTRYFGLGNLNKMKQLNDGGAAIAEMVKSDPDLKDKNVRIWTGDTLTAASVYNQIIEIPGLTELFYIGANGKIGNAVCSLILTTHPSTRICVYSSYEGIKHPNITYTRNIDDMLKYKVIVVGKLLQTDTYLNSFDRASVQSTPCKTRFILDYTVPFIPIKPKSHPSIKHIPIGLLQVTSRSFLRGHFDICMSHDENHIYPCHAGCIINSHEERETDETGDVCPIEMQKMWKKALKYGFQNRMIDYS